MRRRVPRGAVESRNIYEVEGKETEWCNSGDSKLEAMATMRTCRKSKAGTGSER
jgi:hypothetical protein